MKNINIKNVTHWIIFVLFIVVSFLAIMNTTFYSKESIIDTFEFSFPMVGILDAGYSDKLFIARIERRAGWVWHFYTGLALSVLLLVNFIYYIKESNKIKNIYKVIYTLLLILFTSGIPLYIRAFINIEMEIQDIARSIHYYTSWLLAATLVFHIINVVTRENNKEKGLISKKINFTKHIPVIIALLFTVSANELYAEDKYYKEAMLYIKKEKSPIIKEIIMPNCPYDNCVRGAQQEEEHVDLDNNMRLLKVKTINYPLATEFLKKSFYEYNNLVSVKKLIKIYLKNINYKDKKIDDSIKAKLEETFLMSGEEIKEEVKKLLIDSSLNKSCYSSYKLAEFYENGYLGFNKNKVTAKKYYKKVLEVCQKNKLEYIMSKPKV